MTTMHPEELQRWTGWTAPWKPTEEETLSNAWSRAPDGRWVLAVALQAGAEPRQVVLAIYECVAALLPDLLDQPPWRGALHMGRSYGRGEIGWADLESLLPPAERSATPDWVHSLSRSLPPALRRRIPDIELQRAASALLRLLQPRSGPESWSRDAATVLGLLASAEAVRRRLEARRVARAQLEEVAEAAPGSFATMLPAVDSPAWDESAERGYADALERCADTIRHTVTPPWERRVREMRED